MHSNVLVLGLGNTLLADDGAGVHVIRRLASDPATPPWLHAVDGGTMGFRLTSLLSGASDVLVVDAAELLAPPGTIRLLDAKAMAAQGRRTSAHEAGLADLLSLARLENFTPRHLAVLAIQPEVITWRESLSDSVAKAITPACAMVNATASAWRRAA